MLEKEISVIKEKIKKYNEIFNLIGNEIAKKSSEEEIMLYGLDNFSYDKYLKLPEEYKDYVRFVIEKCLKLNNDYKFSKLVIQLDSNKFNGDVDRFFKYGEFLKKILKDSREVRTGEFVTKGKNYVKNIFKRKKSVGEKKEISFNDIKHYIKMALIIIASIVLFNTIKPIARQIGIVMSGVKNTFVLATLAICAYNQVKYMVIKRNEKKKEEEFLEKIIKKIGKEETKDLKKEKKVEKKEEKEFDDVLLMDDFEEFLNDEKILEEEKDFSDIFEKRKYKQTEEIEDDFLLGNEDIFGNYHKEEKEVIDFPSKREEEYDDFLQDEEDVFGNRHKEEEAFIDFSSKREEEYDDFLQDEEDVFGNHHKEEEAFIDFSSKREEEYDDFLQDEEDIFGDYVDDYFEIEEENDDVKDLLPVETINEEIKDNFDEEGKKIEEENEFNSVNKELITVKKIRDEIERTKLLKDELESLVKIKNDKIIEFRKNSGKRHNELIKENAEYIKLYKEKTRMDSLYKEACSVFNYSLNTYYLISNGAQITMNEYFSKLKENNGKKK